MYKRTIKKGGKEYTYYYHNFRVDGSVRNFCIGKTIEEAEKRLLQLKRIHLNGNGRKGVIEDRMF